MWVTFPIHQCRLPGQTILSHKILPGFAFSEQVLQLFVAYSLLDILNDILKKRFYPRWIKD